MSAVSGYRCPPGGIPPGMLLRLTHSGRAVMVSLTLVAASSGSSSRRGSGSSARSTTGSACIARCGCGTSGGRIRSPRMSLSKHRQMSLLGGRRRDMKGHVRDMSRDMKNMPLPAKGTFRDVFCTHMTLCVFSERFPRSLVPARGFHGDMQIHVPNVPTCPLAKSGGFGGR
ncbi:hypothetical protein Henu3_gp22 [Mycobacterium phage Henu3]|uniref:Uncharacterized protein n=1 Tax=Mycobacterium phage Henu3 TaxID=2492961 RepID=A0A410T806_9CAUD|nr:hypothetical protein I5G68_gp19 [Mycobacterium phage Henu3]QAU04969.1 hypothetical protein Henu3_gp22 [Mycobacterium phage Henu3]